MRSFYIVPSTETVVEYNRGVYLDKKRFGLQKYGFEMTKEDNHEPRVVGLMAPNTIYEISKDMDVEKISGTILCASYLEIWDAAV
jgi:hypothetical protein